MKLVIALVILNATLVFGQNEPPVIDGVNCGTRSLEVVFLNGVRNSTSQAEESKQRIWELVRNDSDNTRISPNGLDDICYKYIYNQTHGYKDFLETLAQKVREDDPQKSALEAYQWVAKYVFTKNFVFDEIAENAGFGRAISAIELSHMMNAESETLKQHTSNIVIKDLKKRSVLLVSHSQGGLFADLIYDEMLKDTTLHPRLNKFANLHVGSASGRLAAREQSFGDHMTLKEDQVISQLPQLGFSVIPVNVESAYVWIDRGNSTRQHFDAYKYDQLGHGFIEAYTESRVKGKLDGETEFVPMSEIFMDKLAGLAEKIWEPKCPSPGRILDTKFNICAQVLSVPKDLNENIVFELSSCNNEASLKEFESLFEDNLIAFYNTAEHNSFPVYHNLNKYKVEGEKLRYSVPRSLIRNYNDFNIQYRMDLKIMQKQFEYGDGRVAQCNDRLSISIIFEGPNLFCPSRYFKHPELSKVYVTESSTVELGSEKVSTESLVHDDNKFGGCEYGVEYKRCATPSNSFGLVCNSSVKKSFFNGNVYNSNIENSIVGANRILAVSNSTIKNALLEYNTVNSNVIDGAFHYLWRKGYCKEAIREFPDNLLLGKSFTNWDAYLEHTSGPACYSYYMINVKRYENGFTGMVHDPQYIDLDHFQEYLYK